MATYDEMVTMVTDWANRDSEVLKGPLVQQVLKWSADKCYRTLRVPSLEYTRQFDVTEDAFVSAERNVESSPGFQTINLPVPQDLIDVIYIRIGGRVFEEKVDQRTFYNENSTKKSDAYWTRTRNIFQLSGRISAGDTIEIHYYRRLPAMNATYNVVAATYNARPGLFTYNSEGEIGSGTTIYNDITATLTPSAASTGYLWWPEGTTDFTTAAIDLPTMPGDIGRYYEDDINAPVEDAAAYNADPSSYTYDNSQQPDMVASILGTGSTDYLWFTAVDTEFTTATDEPVNFGVSGDIGRHYTANAGVEITADNYNEGGAATNNFVYAPAVVTENIPGQVVAGSVDEFIENHLWFRPEDTNFSTAYDASQAIGDIGRLYTGDEVDHWLRDENERIVLFGALLEAFNYLDEQDQVQKFGAMFEKEIDELNREEKMRQAVGGNVSVNFTSHLI